jgi:hypothetical protein
MEHKVNNAFEFEFDYDKDGKCRKRRVVIGGIVVWAIVVTVFCLAGHTLLTIPASFGNWWGVLR